MLESNNQRAEPAKERGQGGESPGSRERTGGSASLAHGNRRQLGGLLLDVGHATDHVEGKLRDVVAGAREHLLEVADGGLQVHERAGSAREDLGHEEGLREEAHDLAGTRHGELVLLAQLVHAQDRDDVLQRLVVLQDLLRAARHIVVALADNGGVEHAGGGVQGIHGRVDAQLGDLPRQHRRRVQVREGGGGGGIGQVVRRHVDGLDRGDRALLRGRDALLQGRQVRRERGLVADGAGDAAQQGGHLGAGLGEAEDVVHEEQHVLALLVAEVLRHREAGQGHAGARARRLVHLAVDQGGLGARGLVLLDDAAGHHLVVQVVALARALAHAGKDAVAAVLQGDVVDELHDHDRLAHARAAEEADLAALGVRRQEVHHLDAREQLLRRRVHLREGRRGAVDGVELLRLDRPELVDRLADDVDDAAERLLAHGDLDRGTRVLHLLPTSEAVCAIHCDGADHVFSQVLRHLQHQPVLETLHLQSIEDGRQSRVKLHVHHGANDLRDLASRSSRRGPLCKAPTLASQSCYQASIRSGKGRTYSTERRALLSAGQTCCKTLHGYSARSRVERGLLPWCRWA
mmetsp:Transcript_51522/g.154011  ORF Transcript_51522/g.154011 Transcript_51522/m.154011 type:complete len:576 (-) Transcript_51522:12-1739(-)